jgi:hypothetical protein
MYGDPITFTVNAVNKVLARVFNPIPGGPSRFAMADETFSCEISHQIIKGKRERHLCKLVQKAITANPFIPAENVENFASCYIVLDNPRQGFTDLDLRYLLKSVSGFMNASDANMDKFIGGEA